MFVNILIRREQLDKNIKKEIRMQKNYQSIQFYRISQLQERFNISRSSIWSWCKQGKFPKPIKLGENCTAWNAEDINKWVEQKINISSQEEN